MWTYYPGVTTMVRAMARWATYSVADSLPDDTEESVVGTEWHQEASGDAADKLREGGRRRGALWGVCEQVALTGLRHADGRPYDPRPDVMVLPAPLPSGRMSSIALSDAGVPLLIVEVASRRTVGNDVGEKRDAYEAIGVSEYLVFDPDGVLLSTPLLAWRLDGGTYRSWLPEADGTWRSAALGLSFVPTQPLLGVRDHQGREIESVGTVHRLLAEQRLLLAEQQLLLAEERRQRLDLEERLRERGNGP